jgi:hypothetical protein
MHAMRTDATAADPIPATYLLPIRRTGTAAGAELTDYLRWLSTLLPVVIVDGSPPAIFAAHAVAWRGIARHLRVDASIDAPNGKVAGTLTGLHHVRTEAVVIADDDVRYDAASLAAVVHALDGVHVVRPQNYFEPLPWHALWDSGRILLNRALDGDWPGTLAVRHSALVGTKGYAGDVLFENLELVRTVVAAGGRQRVAREVLVRRLPPSSRHFWSQRVRQAYDEFARPARLVAQLAMLPTIALLLRAGRATPLVVGALGTVALAEYGRRRDGGRRVFPARASAMAPVWGLERAVTVWLAIATRLLRGGVRYADGRLVHAGTSPRALRRRHAGAIPSGAPAAITSTSIGLKAPLFDSSAEQAVTPTIRSISARNSR